MVIPKRHFPGFRLNLELRDNEGCVPLWLALSRDARVDPMDEDSLAAKLVKYGASPDAVNNVTGQWSPLVSLSVAFYDAIHPLTTIMKSASFYCLLKQNC